MSSLSICYGLLGPCLVASVACFRANQKYRSAIDISLASADSLPMRIPERRTSYDAAYLDAFKALAGSRRTSFGTDALSLYVRPVLLWIDVGFAVSLSLAIVFFWYLFPFLFPSIPYVGEVSTFCLWMGLTYGLADVAEDVCLARLLGDPSRTGTTEATIACNLTRLKLATICLSVAGGLLFLAYSHAFAGRPEIGSSGR